MIKKQYNLRAGYYHNYTGICSDTDENLTTNEVVDLLNEQESLIKELLYQFGELGYNNQSCKDCISYAEDIDYCTMYDMDVKAKDIVIRCEEREIKRRNDVE